MAPLLIDGRGLLPPEPLERTLRALANLPEGEPLTLLVNCHPEPLLFLLDDYGFDCTETVHPDGTHELLIRRAAVDGTK